MKPKHPVVLARERYQQDLEARRRNPRPSKFGVWYDKLMRERKESEARENWNLFRIVMLRLIEEGAFRT